MERILPTDLLRTLLVLARTRSFSVVSQDVVLERNKQSWSES